jgi:hypothetical protein
MAGLYTLPVANSLSYNRIVSRAAARQEKSRSTIARPD